MEMEEYKVRVTRGQRRTKAGSALILAVVLTSLLALIGTMFLMAARVDSIGTSAISQNRDLNSAVEAVVANISQELSQDVPGMRGAEYYDYPGNSDRWLASLEPYDDGGYKWRQISDVTGFLEDSGFGVADVSIDPPGPGRYITEYPKIVLDSDGELEEQLADADGDGIADSKWIELDGMTSSKGETIYAAVRVVDNGGMINVNTAYEFDPNGATSASDIDGSSQLQIDLAALARVADDVDDIENARNPLGEPFSDYERDCIWRIEDPCRDYLPFDISDELELRNRYFLTTLGMTRLEDTWFSTIGHSNFKRVPYGQNGTDDDWWEAINQDANQPDRRHFLTTYNTDRIINPAGEKMLSVNDPNVAIDSLYRTIKSAIGPNDPNSEDAAAQMAVDLVDWRDNDSNVSYYNVNGVTYYGFERPCVYISELAHRFYDPNLPSGLLRFYRSYAIELHKPYFEDNDPCGGEWRVFIDNSGSLVPTPDVNVEINWSGTRRFHVIHWRCPDADYWLDVTFDDVDDPNVDYDRSKYNSPEDYFDDIAIGTTIFNEHSRIYLRRPVNGRWVTVDYVEPPEPVQDGWLQSVTSPQSIQRDIRLHKCIRRLWANATQARLPTLGRANTYTDTTDTGMIQAHPANKNFTNVGEITRLFRKSAYGVNGIGYSSDRDEEHEVRFDLADPNMREVFKYLTRFDPSSDNINNDGDNQTDETTLTQTPEFKVAGRININTAPWYVIAQLPWVQYEDNQPFERAKAICDYRDNTLDGFENIGELIRVDEMKNLGSDGDDNLFSASPRGPDLTDDTVLDDFEERDVIFARVSDLATVRSDVFTAYILVRIGVDGPQRRALAILDRSNVYPDPSGGVIGRVKVAALHPVPDPR